MTSGVVREILHFQKTNLVKATGENVNHMAVIRRTLGETIIELFLVSDCGYRELW